MKKVILASASPRRQELLNQIGIKHQVMINEVDESSIGELEPDQLVKRLAELKARSVADKLNFKEDAIIIGADTVVTLDDKVLGKPTDKEDARDMLISLSGRMHTVYTGVSIINNADKEVETFVQETKVYMRDIGKQEIENYIETGEPFDKAGSYAIQGMGGVFVDKIDGDYFSVVGLPISKLYKRLKKFI